MQEEVRDITGLLKLVAEAALLNLEKAGVKVDDRAARPLVRHLTEKFAQGAISAAKHPVREALFDRTQLEALVALDAKITKELRHAVVCAFLESDFLQNATDTTWLFRAFGHVFSLTTRDGKLRAYHVCL